MTKITLFGAATALMLQLSAPSFAADQVTVDRAEYEQLKAAVEMMLQERAQTKADAKETHELATAAKKSADEANAFAEAAVEAAESSLSSTLNKVTLGGYGEVHYNNLQAKDSANDVEESDIHRFVLFAGYEYSDSIRFYSEFEIEHGVAGEGKNGEVEIEQAYIEWDFAENSSALAGVFLLPIGIMNETHEPNTFYGVERNNVEKMIIPSTWWESGVMVSHHTDAGLKIEVAAHSGLKLPESGSKMYAVRYGRQKASEADTHELAYTAAVTYTGIAGLEIGAAINYQEDVTQVKNDGREEALLWVAHAIYNNGPFGLRALYAEWDIDGDVAKAANMDKQDGYYIEPSYMATEKLGFFGRYEDVRAGRGADRFDQVSLGFNYWLHPQVVLKFNWEERKHELSADKATRDYDGYNLGVGWSF